MTNPYCDALRIEVPVLAHVKDHPELALRSRSAASPRALRSAETVTTTHSILDDEVDLWAFRLGLRPPKAPRLSVVPPMAELIAGVEEPLTVGELDEA